MNDLSAFAPAELAAEPDSVERLLGGLKRRYTGSITAAYEIPARAASYSDFPAELDGRLAPLCKDPHNAAKRP